MRTLIVVLLSCAVALDAGLMSSRRNKWELFKKNFGRQYKSLTEEKQRMKIFFDNLELIDEHNAKYEAGQSGFTMGVTNFADMSNEEYQRVMLTGRKTQSQYQKYLNPKRVHTMNGRSEDPTSIDWRDYGYVSPVKDQGQCGSCWAFSTTGVLEGFMFNQTRLMVELSEQNLMDCSYDQGNNACNGGMQEYAVDYVVANGGIDTEALYPYEENSTKNCRYDPANSGAKCAGYTSILPRGDEIVQRSAVATVGPVSFSMDASLPSFQLYHNGTYDDPLCKTKFLEMDHAVLGVGYGTDETGDFWIVKNSWNTNWGMAGYFNIKRGNNTCGIATDSLYVY